MPKILLVEDDKDLTRVVEEFLQRDYSLDISHNGEEGLEYLRHRRYDAAILDWDLPDLSGIDICTQFRATGGTTPILILTGKSRIADKEAGFESGADDYLTKPFEMRELSARLRALMRRATPSLSNLFTVRNLELDALRHTIKKDGKNVHLLKKDFALLEFLMRYPDEIFSSEALLERVWSSDLEAGSDALRTSIKRIRRAIDDDSAEDNSIIENVARVGYRLRQ